MGEAASLFGVGSEASLTFEESYGVWGLPALAFATFQVFASLAGDLGQATVFPAVFLVASLGALACSFALKR